MQNPDADDAFRAKRIATLPWLPRTDADREGQDVVQALLQRLAGASFGRRCFVAAEARVFTDSLRMGDDSVIGAGAVLHGRIEIGEACSIGASAQLSGTVSLGRGCHVAALACLSGAGQEPGQAGLGVRLEEGVRIGENAVVTDGVTIGAHCIVAPGAVVTESCAPHQILEGNPARPRDGRARMPAPERPPARPSSERPPAQPNNGRVRRLLHDTDPYAELQHAYPQDMQGWGSKDPIFRRMITKHRPRLIVEVGTWKGASAIHMAGICQEIGLEAEIVCVDTWLGNWQHWKRKEGVGSRADLKMRNGFPTLYFQFLSNVIAAGHQARITPLPLTGVAAAKLFAAYGIRPDLIYIDGDHEYESVIGDLRGWLPLLNEGGILIGDDHDFPGVSTAVREVVAEGRYAGEAGEKKFWFQHRAP